MRGIVPSSAAAGSSAAGTPGTPMRTSRRILGGPGALGGWAGADAGHTRTSVNRMTGRRTSRTRIDILDTYIRGTLGVCQPVRLAEERGERYETCCPKLTVAERTCGPGPERPMRGKNPANSRIQLTVSKRPTLTFFFPAAYTSSTRRVLLDERRTHVRRDGL